MNPVDFENRRIGDGEPAFVIAEAGVNHNGDPELAHRLVDAAAEAGADAVKFQTFDPVALAAADATLAEYQRASAGRSSGQRDMLAGLALPAEEVQLDLERAIPCGLLLNELVTNAFKHAFPGERHGEIVIELNKDAAGRVCLSIADDGIGLPAEADLAQGSSLGLQLVQLFVEQLHGATEITRQPGTRILISFPHANPKETS